MIIAQNTVSAGPSPRVALFFSDSRVLNELQAILSETYSSLLIVTDREKLKEFPFPMMIVVDHIHQVAKIRELHPVEGTEVFLVAHPEQAEMIAAGFEAGASDYLSYPFSPQEIIEKSEKYLRRFRSE